jgi:hypothetical protein
VAARSFLQRVRSVVRVTAHAVFDASREGRAAEITAWANAIGAFAVALGTTALLREHAGSRATWIGLAVGMVTFVALRLALAHRYTVWLAGALGTLSVASLAGAAGWVFGHLAEAPSAPSIAAVTCALLAAVVPGWGYAQVAKRRANHERDSLVDPISVPGSR